MRKSARIVHASRSHKRTVRRVSVRPKIASNGISYFTHSHVAILSTRLPRFSGRADGRFPHDVRRGGRPAEPPPPRSQRWLISGGDPVGGRARSRPLLQRRAVCVGGTS